MVSLVNSRPHPRQGALYPSSWNALSLQLTCQCPLLLLCFQSLTTIKFGNPFVLITMQNARGVGVLPSVHVQSVQHFQTACAIARFRGRKEYCSRRSAATPESNNCYSGCHYPA